METPSDTAALIDRLPGLVAVIGADRRYRYVNAGFAALAGAPCHDLVGTRAAPGLEDALIAAAEGRSVPVRCDLGDRSIRGTIAPDGGAGDAILVAVEDDGHDAAAADDAAILNQAFDNAPTGKVVVDPEGRMLRVNPAFERIVGIPAAALIGRTFAAVTHPDDLDAGVDLFRAVLAGRRNGYQLDQRYLRGDGSVAQVRVRVTVVRDRHAQPMRLVAQIEDVTEVRRAQARSRAASARLALAVDAINGGFWHMDVATGVFETSNKLSRFTAGAEQPLELASYVAHVHRDDLAAADLSPLIEGKVDALTAEYRLVGPDGSRWVRCDRRLVRRADGSPEQIVGVVIDITAERERRRQAEAEADTDGLTGLLNRRGAMRRIDKLDRTSSCGVVAIDLDRFKAINDQFGHQAGDDVLRTCAQRLRQELRAGDVVSRLGGDEFLIVMPGVSKAVLNLVAGRLRHALGRPLRRGDSLLPIGGSIGAVWCDVTPENLTDLIADADAALYRDKAERRERRQA